MKMDKAEAASLIQKTWRNYVILRYRKIKEVFQAIQEELHHYEDHQDIKQVCVLC